MSLFSRRIVSTDSVTLGRDAEGILQAALDNGLLVSSDEHLSVLFNFILEILAVGSVPLSDSFSRLLNVSEPCVLRFLCE